MEYYPLIIVLHIVFAGMWLTSFLLSPLFKSAIYSSKNKIGEKKFIHFYLIYSNLLGIVSSIGVLVTGIVLVILNPGFGFFSMSANHWLATKQIIMVVILVIIGGFIVPTAKKLRLSIGADLENASQLSEESYKDLNKLFKLGLAINVLVLINFLLALTHNYLG
jgi:uncharacterized membrane protein